MRDDDNPLSQDGLPRKMAALVIRGVGEAGADEAVESLKLVLREHGVASAREINWSWTEVVEWPYADASDKAKAAKRSLPRSLFLRHLGFSVLNTAGRDLSARTRWSKALLSIVRVLLWPSTLVPALIAALPILLMLRAIRGGGIALVVGFLSLPLAVSLLGFDLALVRSTLRVLLLRTLWPLAFPVLVGLSYGWILPLYIAIVVAAMILSSAVVPEHWRYSLFGTSRADTFENSIWVTLLQYLGGYLGSAIALLAITALLRKLIPGLSFLFKIAADVARYLGDSDYRSGVQQEVKKEMDCLFDAGTEDVLIFAHSLGTVIAIDFLRNTPPQGFRSIKLITCGSPLRRLFWGFFAHDYDGPAQMFHAVTQSLQEYGVGFAWFNVYRRKDPIGRSLGLPPGHDQALEKEGETLWNAHLDYWTDEAAHEMVIRLLSGDLAVENDLGTVSEKQPAGPQA